MIGLSGLLLRSASGAKLTWVPTRRRSGAGRARRASSRWKAEREGPERPAARPPVRRRTRPPTPPRGVYARASSLGVGVAAVLLRSGAGTCAGAWHRGAARRFAPPDR